MGDSSWRGWSSVRRPSVVRHDAGRRILGPACQGPKVIVVIVQTKKSPLAGASARSSANDLILCDLFDFGTDLHFAAGIRTVVDVRLEPDVDVNTTDLACELECAARAV